MSRASRGSHRARRLRHAAGAVLCVAILAQVSPGNADPQQTKERLEKARKEVAGLEGRVKTATRRLAEVQAELQQLTTRIAQATSQVEAISAAIAEARGEIKRSNRQANRLQGTLDERARDAYITGPAGALELVLEAESLAELASRLGFLEVLSREDANVATGIETEKRQVAEFRGALRGYLEEKRRLLQQLEGQRGVFEAKQQEVLAAKESLEEELDAAERAVEGLQKRYQRELRAQILAAQAAAAARAAQAQGGSTSGVALAGPPPRADGPLYHCPVDPPRSYIDDFGAPRSGGRSHQGNDIFAPAGTAIRAPFAGRAQEGSNSLGGLTVHVYASANGDFVYNAHLSRFAGVSGRTVQPGDVIGYVGNTGNAVGTPPHNHFEYHPGGGGAVSPYIYLNEVCGVGGAG